MLTPKFLKWTLFTSAFAVIVIYRLLATPEMFELMVAMVVAGYILLAIGTYIINGAIRYWLEIYFRTIDNILNYIYGDDKQEQEIQPERKEPPTNE